MMADLKIHQLQLFQYEETLWKLKRQLAHYEAELSLSWQSEEAIPFRETLVELQYQLQLCYQICDEIAGSMNVVY